MFVGVKVEWEWQRLGLFRGLVVAQVALVSDRDADPGWIVYLTGHSQALDRRLPTEFDAMAAALCPPGHGGSRDRRRARSVSWRHLTPRPSTDGHASRATCYGAIAGAPSCP